MEEIKKEDLDYTFKKWLKGTPEPNHHFWRIKNRDEALKISEAKQSTFKVALDLTIEFYKNAVPDKLNKIKPEDRKLYLEALLEESEKKVGNFGIKEIIDQNHPEKFNEINGKKYLKVLESKEKNESGEYLYTAFYLNKFFDSVLHFYLSKYYKDLLNNNPDDKKDSVKVDSKGESASVKYLLIDHFFQENKEFKKLLIKDQNKLISIILGNRSDSAKDIKRLTNKALNGKPDGKHITEQAYSRFTDLLEKIKKGKTF